MKKILYTLISISILIVSLAIAGCGNDGDKYLGTWAIKFDNGAYSYFVITKGEIKDSYLVTDYNFSKSSMNDVYGSTVGASIKDKTLEDNNGVHYVLKENKLILNNGRTVYNKVSDKSMTLDEIKSNANTN